MPTQAIKSSEAEKSNAYDKENQIIMVHEMGSTPAYNNLLH